MDLFGVGGGPSLGALQFGHVFTGERVLCVSVCDPVSVAVCVRVRVSLSGGGGRAPYLFGVIVNH